METLREFIVANPILATTLSGLWGAILLDLISFANSKDPGGFFTGFSWRTAAMKYVQATVAGFIGNFTLAAGAAGAGIGALVLWSLM